MFGDFVIALAIPITGIALLRKPSIRFEERAAGSPQAIKAWFTRAVTMVMNLCIQEPKPWR